MYLDPGFGSMVIQLVIAGIAAAGSFLYLFRQKIKEFFKCSKIDNIENDAPPPEETSKHGL
ncbi:hypothetical protein FACS1894137_15510 [Spirochaetia bacterium]|nr:hypothetical protein FACS1894137_15510 [Spirochaetia bacterium]